MSNSGAMEASQDSERFFNDDYNASSLSGDIAAFHLFDRLPKELRVKIWKHSLPRQRFIDLSITEPGYHGQYRDNNAESDYYATRNRLGNVVSGYPYSVETPKRSGWPLSLLLVNREANEAFCKYFRLHLPLKSGVLHVNPEGDILHVWTGKVLTALLTPIEALVAFFHDLVAYDPRGVGIVHVGIGREVNDLSRLTELEPSAVPQPAAASIRKLLERSLRTLYVIRSSSDGRNMLGMLSFPKAKVHQNRSLPVAAQSLGAVTWLDHDPRPIEDDLSHLGIGRDPRYTSTLWRKFEHRFGVRREKRPIDILYALASWPRNGVNGRAGLAGFLQDSDESWASWMGRINHPLWGARLSEEAYRRRLRDLRQAAGIWIFPAEAFGPIPVLEDPNNLQVSQWEVKMVKDLSEFRPALVVFDLH